MERGPSQCGLSFEQFHHFPMLIALAFRWPAFGGTLLAAGPGGTLGRRRPRARKARGAFRTLAEGDVATRGEDRCVFAAGYALFAALGEGGLFGVFLRVMAGDHRCCDLRLGHRVSDRPPALLCRWRLRILRSTG